MTSYFSTRVYREDEQRQTNFLADFPSSYEEASASPALETTASFILIYTNYVPLSGNLMVKW